MALSPVVGDIPEIRERLFGRTVLVTIAFDDPEGLAMHLGLVRRYVAHDVHLVADNSQDDANAERNRAIAAEQGAPYLRLPANPWTRRNESRSHGLSLNWIWHNVLKSAQPKAFGLIDDDMFPIAPCDPFEPLARHDFHGDHRTMDGRWFLWAGFSFFRFDAVRDKPLDFGLDWFNRLDTGGANWDVLYRFADLAALPRRPIEQIAVLPGYSKTEAYFEVRGEWIHEVGWPREAAIRDAKRAVLKELLAPHLAN